MAALEYFDCNAMLGRYFNPAFGQYLTASSLQIEYEQFGMSGGIVYHSSARDYAPAYGNEVLLKEIAGYAGLHPAWVVAPHQTGEMPSPTELEGQLKDCGVRLVRIFCARWYYTDTLDPFIYGELLEMLDHHRIPVMVEFEASETHAGGLDSQVWRDLQAVCGSFPELRLVLACPKSTGLNRALFPLLEKHKHLAMETSGYQLFGGFETIVRRFGADRLLFGSRLPYMSACLGMAALQYAEINEEEKELIAGGNLRRLISEVDL